jgi:hypothetical protein
VSVRAYARIEETAFIVVPASGNIFTSIAAKPKEGKRPPILVQRSAPLFLRLELKK